METIQGSREDCEAGTARVLALEIGKLLASQDKVCLGLCGGSSVGKIYSLLVDEDVAWEKVHIFMADERLVPLEHADSNFRLVKEALVDRLLQAKKIPKENIHPFVFLSGKAEVSVVNYVDVLKDTGGKLDIVVLSSGEDGHVAGLFPKHDSFYSDASFIQVFDTSPKPPKNRMSITKKLLNQAQVGFLLFLGDEKEKAYSRFKDASVDEEECPAKLMKKLAKSYVVSDL